MTGALLAAALVACLAPAGPPIPVGPNASTALDYRVVEPPFLLEADAPIVIAIHGMGDTGRGFAGYVQRLQVPFRVVVPDGPLRFGSGPGRSWYHARDPRAEADVERSTALLLQLIDHIRARWPEAPPPFLIGFSQGGVMGMSMAVRHPREISGVVAISGYLVGDRRQLPPAPRGATPLLVVHGRQDAVVPFERGRDAVDRLRRSGYIVDFFEHGGEHKIPRRATDTARLWLLEKAEWLTGHAWLIR